MLLLQTGDGHFSPIGGYHAARDLVLILDVARFKYPPHWVPLPLLWRAMQQSDKVTGESRGYVVLTSRSQPSAALFSLVGSLPVLLEACCFAWMSKFVCEHIPGRVPRFLRVYVRVLVAKRA